MSKLYRVVATFIETHEAYFQADSEEEVNDLIDDTDWSYPVTEDWSFEIEEMPDE